MINTVCVFASSCNYLDETYYEAAKELGTLLAEADMDLVYGGSCLGLMWACAQKVKENGGRITGVMPEKLHEMDVFSDYCDEFFLTPCMRSRKAKMDEYAQYRKTKQPIEYPSAGSTFKRGKDYITAKLIDDAGLKGYSIGDAVVSTKHSGFVINKGNASAKDVLDLVKYIKDTIEKKFNKQIELEIEVVGKEVG